MKTPTVSLQSMVTATKIHHAYTEQHQLCTAWYPIILLNLSKTAMNMVKALHACPTCWEAVSSYSDLAI